MADILKNSQNFFRRTWNNKKMIFQKFGIWPEEHFLKMSPKYPYKEVIDQLSSSWDLTMP